MWRFKRIIYVSNIACGCSVDKAVLICIHSICSEQKYGKNRKKGHFKAVSFAVHGNFAVKDVIYVSRHCLWVLGR